MSELDKIKQLMPFIEDTNKSKYNEPSNLVYVLEAIAIILEKDKHMLAKELYNNSCK